MKILCFGNEMVKEDSLAKEIADELGAIKCSRVEDVLKIQEENPDEEIVIVDVVEGLTKVMGLTIDKLKIPDIVSLHDFDLAFFLKLLEKTGTIKHIKIIGIPMKGDRGKIISDVNQFLH